MRDGPTAAGRIACFLVTLSGQAGDMVTGRVPQTYHKSKKKCPYTGGPLGDDRLHRPTSVADYRRPPLLRGSCEEET
jgi:hypothetical protein